MQGDHRPSTGPYGLSRCRDGSVRTAVGPATPGTAANGGRVERRDEVIAWLDGAA